LTHATHTARGCCVEGGEPAVKSAAGEPSSATVGTYQQFVMGYVRVYPHLHRYTMVYHGIPKIYDLKKIDIVNLGLFWGRNYSIWDVISSGRLEGRVPVHVVCE
jgi:hypothetical protein